MKKIVFASAFLFFALAGFAQSKQDKEKARELGYEGIKLLDEGQYEQAIELLEQAQKLDAEDPVYSYEIAYGHYAQKQYKKAVDMLESIIDHKKATDQYYQLLGNSYDNMKKPELALETYAKGLKRFPGSGKLYLESGIVEYYLKNYDEAIAYWEKGIQVDPKFPSNYFWLGRTFSYTEEKVWAIIYGEIFMNLERGSKRTEEMSKILYDTYKSAITIKSPVEVNTNFSKVMTMQVPADGEKPKLPFSMNYDLNMTVGVTISMIKGNTVMSIDLLADTREAFLKSWFEKNMDKDYPNALFDYQKKIADKGHSEAYTYWLLMKGNEEEFNKWMEDKNNSAKYSAFLEWYKGNAIALNDKNRFYRTQY